MLVRFNDGGHARNGGTPSDWEEVEDKEESVINTETDIVFCPERYMLLAMYTTYKALILFQFTLPCRMRSYEQQRGKGNNGH